jgi:isopenicillin N synthase-like dioxygenase
MRTERTLAVIDMAPLLGADPGGRAAVADAIGEACRQDGFFYVRGHGVADETIARLDAEARAFFALPEPRKAEIAMPRGGAAWRGWFPLGGELTSGAPDQKEGVYFGEELGASDPRVRDGWPMHGANLWPDQPAALRGAAEAYMAETTRAAAALMEGVSLALGLPADHFARAYLRRPTVLFRIFRYPPAVDDGWGVGEHTDYGLLTLLAQDQQGGLQVRTDDGWIDAPPIDGTLVCNVGDMLERLSGGRFVSAPHRVINRSGGERLSLPLFYDPDFEAEMTPALDPIDRQHRHRPRWDEVDPNAFAGRYGDYLQRKVGAVFPGLRAAKASLGAP